MTGCPGKIVVFGAGNIGRSFIGQVFSRAGWEVVFIDVDASLVDALNERRGYTIIVKQQGLRDETIGIDDIRAVDGRDIGGAADELADAAMAACAVGKAALPKIAPVLARGLLARAVKAPPLDFILAENDREARSHLLGAIRQFLPPDFPLSDRLGLVETSIGKMVPIMHAEDLATDRLRIFAEPYNELIVDRKGFLGPLPGIPFVRPVDNILAYVDRKLFIHNLGHAAVAYLGHRAAPSETLIWRALAIPAVAAGARLAMTEAAAALAREYPAEFTSGALEEHIEELLSRFSNAALGDTIYRVGRDLPRKLDRSDRIVGAALLCERHGLGWGGIADVFRAALDFGATDESGAPFPADSAFRERLHEEGIRSILGSVCRLDWANVFDARVAAVLLRMWPPD
jgi:mannitol-1-phosphate 5-dehydrogenase